MEGWDEACLHNLLECPHVQGQASLIGSPWRGLWQLTFIKFCFSQIREVQIRVLSASVVAQMFPL